MKKINKSKLIISIVLLIVTAGLVWLNSTMKAKPENFRLPASSEQDSFKDMILQSARFQESPSEVKITLFSEQQDFCELWSAMEVTFRAEGIAYSGEPSRAVQSVVCESGGFEQIWPKDLMKDHPGIQKLGHFEESPPEWAVETIKVLGPSGTVEVSGVEIYRALGALFVFEAP